MGSLQEFAERARRVGEVLREYAGSEAVLVFHDDADGIASAAITSRALERLGIGARLVCLEKTYPFALEKLHEREGSLLVYCDIGSAHADWISEYNRGRNLVVILDHHDPKPARDEKIVDLNLEHYGFKGEEEFSGSTVCYLFAKCVDEANRDLVHLALVGAAEIPGGYRGLNELVLREALESGSVARRGRDLVIRELDCTVRELFQVLQVLGAVGYYSGGPELGVEACLEGLSSAVRDLAKRLEGRRKRANKRVLAMLYRRGLEEGEYVQWFDAGSAFRGMGAKVVGQFCSYLQYRRGLVKPDKYLLGFMDLQRTIPGLGEIEGEFSKFSLRTPELVRRKIGAGEMPPAASVLEEAAEACGGFADGHAYAASGVVPAERKAELAELLDRAVGERVAR